MGQVAGASPFGGAKYVKYSVRFFAKSGSSTTSCRPCAATDFTPGTPASGADTTPSGLTIRMVPAFCVTSRLPSGRNAIAHAPVSPVAIVCVLNGDDALAGRGASVCPGKAGLGSGDCAPTIALRTAANVTTIASDLFITISFTVGRVLFFGPGSWDVSRKPAGPQIRTRPS